MEKHASQFKGNNQHDAQEFLLWLLDRVHEDLNVATKRRYKSYGGRNSNGNSETFSDEVLAAEALANYIRHNRRLDISFGITYMLGKVAKVYMNDHVVEAFV